MPVIELDTLIALVNVLDKLHELAVRIINMVMNGELRNVAVPTSAYLEYELVLRSKGYSEEEVLTDLESFRSLRNLAEIPLTSRIISEAIRLRRKYELTYFDSLHAASALMYDKIMISVDPAYRNVPNLRVIDPLRLLKKNDSP